jgi:hypothetical protein
MAGYYHERLATGTHDPLKARAIVFRGAERQAALVVCDLTVNLIRLIVDRLGGARRLVRGVVALKDLDERLQLRIVRIGPVGALIGGGGVQGADAAGLAQILVKTWRVVLHRGGHRFGQGQCAMTALRPDHVAMTVRIADAALVAVHGDERSWHGIEIVGLLRPPPAIFVIVAHVVIGDQNEIEGGGIET